MASLQPEGSGWRIKWYNGTKRQSIRIGKMTERNARRYFDKVEDLISMKATGQRDEAALEWASKRPEAIQAKLERHGLIPCRRWTDATLGGLLDAYFDTLDVKPGTKTTYRQTRTSLEAHFGPDTFLAAITPLDADEWRQSMKPDTGKRLADATISKRVKTARQIFGQGERWGMVRQNPFVGVKAGAQTNRSRLYFVSRDDAARVLETCPDAEWRLIFALSRYGGLRCPSEHLRLRWVDVDWERGRLTVWSPKTEGHEGGECRTLPIFPELEPYLQAAWDRAPEGAEWVIARYRDANANLRTQLQRIIARAGVQPWPRLFHNLRATRQTELAETFPIHVVCQWLGNTGAVAADHYLQVTDAHFERAVKEPTGATQKPAPNPAPSGSIRPRQEPQRAQTEPREIGSGGSVKAGAGCGWKEKVTPRGFEPRFSG